MQSIRSAVFHTAQPVGASAATNSQSHNVPFAKGFLRGPQCGHPIRKNTFVLCKSMCACYFVSPGHCLQHTDCQFRRMGAGTMSLLGGGARPRMVPQAPPGNRMKDTDCYFRRMGAGSMTLLALLGCGATPHEAPVYFRFMNSIFPGQGESGLPVGPQAQPPLQCRQRPVSRPASASLAKL